MEDTLKEFKYYDNRCETSNVLILVVMEDTLKDMDGNELFTEENAF